MERSEIYKLLREDFGLTPLRECGRGPRIFGEDVRIGENVDFGEGVIIYNNVIIGNNVRIGNGVILNNVLVGNRCSIEDYSIIGYCTLTGGFSHKLSDHLGPGQTILGAETLIRTHCVIYQGVKIGEHCWINHMVLLREKTKIGDYTCIGTMCDSEGYNNIGSHCLIHSAVQIGARTTIEDYVFVAPFTAFTNGNPMNYARDFVSREEGPIIRFGTQIAANVIVYPRVIVGYESLIGASAVVTKSVPSLGIVMGIPGRVVGRVPDDLRMPQKIRSQYYNGKLDPDE